MLALADEAAAIIACDGALTTCLEHGLRPDAVVGDMDSVEQ
ncbi:MAG: thiamine diphosphokinase, partial [Candidatus Thermoplasmatota archaeon]|nr:thiamine diphosphokinase [Candidatus Thermoplasmatota archaeon]